MTVTAASMEGTRVGPSPYRPEIDGLRALAVIAVIINHTNANRLPSGYLGVDIFFVISGFVVTSSLANHRQESARDFFLGFYARRVKRLVPALLVFVVITSGLISLFDPDPGEALGLGIRALFGIANLNLYAGATDYFAKATEFNPFTHTWSLGVEEQFYLLLPGLIWFSGFGRSGGKGDRQLQGLMTILSVASLVAFLYLYPRDQPGAYFLMPARLWELGAGCLLFLNLRKPGGVLRTIAAWPPLLITGLLLGSLLLPVNWAILVTPLVVALTACLIAALRPGTSAYALFTHNSVVGIGLMSYSLYLWHWSVLALSRWTVGIHWWSIPFQAALMAGLAYGSYRYIETPLRRSSWSGQPWHTLGLGVLASGVATGMVFTTARLGSKHLYLGKTAPQHSFDPTLKALRKDCAIKTNGENAQEIRSHGQRSCTLPPRRNGAQRILLMGDSHARQYLPLMLAIQNTSGAGLGHLSTLRSLFPPQPYVDQEINRKLWQQVNGIRQEFYDARFSELKAGDLVVISNRYEQHFIHQKPTTEENDLHQVLMSEQWTPVDEATAFQQWLSRLGTMADQANNQGVNVVVVAPSPVFWIDRELPRSFPQGICSPQWFRLAIADECPSSYREERRTMEARMEPFRAGLNQLARRHRNLYVYDPFPLLCPASQTQCGTVINGVQIYDDYSHLATEGALSLLPDFKGFLDRHRLLKAGG